MKFFSIKDKLFNIKDKSKTCIGLQLTDKVLRIVELDSNKKPLWEAVEVILDGKNKEDVLREIVQKHGLYGKSVCACVPVNEGLLKFYKYPASISKKDLLSAIDWSIKREKSSIKEEIYYDYYIWDQKLKGDQVGVVLVFSRKERVENIRSILNNVGLKLHVLDYEVVAIVNYGFYHKLPIPFSILYIDYDYSTLTTYSSENITYSHITWSLSDYLANKNDEHLDNFFAEVRNIIVLNDITSLYVAGPILSQENLVSRLMENVPILGLLDIEDLKPNFFIPYILSIRGMEG